MIVVNFTVGGLGHVLVPVGQCLGQSGMAVRAHAENQPHYGSGVQTRFFHWAWISRILQTGDRFRCSSQVSMIGAT